MSPRRWAVALLTAAALAVLAAPAGAQQVVDAGGGPKNGSGGVAFIAFALMCAGIAYYILARCLMSTHGRDSAIARAMGDDFKGKISVVIYGIAIPLAFVRWWLAFGLYVVVAAIWFIPDRRIEKGSDPK